MNHNTYHSLEVAVLVPIGALSLIVRIKASPLDKFDQEKMESAVEEAKDEMIIADEGVSE